MVPGQLRINFYTPGIQATRHGSGMCKTVTREIRRCIQTSDTVMTDKNDFPIFRPFRHYLLHQLLSEKRRALEVHSIPFFPAADINQRELFARPEPFRDFSRQNLHFLISVVGADDCRDHVLNGQIVIAHANTGQSLSRSETTTRAAADVISLEEGSLSTWILLEKLRHRGVGVDCSRHAHGYQRYIISPENQKGPASDVAEYSKF
jgi:hypothetical protein